jgi:hypothetical protein
MMCNQLIGKAQIKKKKLTRDALGIQSLVWRTGPLCSNYPQYLNFFHCIHYPIHFQVTCHHFIALFLPSDFHQDDLLVHQAHRHDSSFINQRFTPIHKGIQQSHI